MQTSITPDVISAILSNPSFDSSSDRPEIVVQVVDLKSTGTRYTFSANDGKTKVKAMFTPEIVSGMVQNLSLIRLLDFTVNSIPMRSLKYFLVTKFEIVASALDSEINLESKNEEEDRVIKKQKLEHSSHVASALDSQINLESKNEDEAGVLQKQKFECVSQMISEMSRNDAVASRLSMTRRVHPLESLNPYQVNWSIKVRVTNKGLMRSYNNAKGQGCVFNVELTDEEGTQIQATMFHHAAKKFYDIFQLGKVYYISRGSLKLANKQFNTVQNDYEMTLNENSEVMEASDGEMFVPKTKFNFVPIEDLGMYVNQRELVDLIGVVQSVSPTLSIRRKIDNEMIPKRDITLADDSKKSVVVSLWNDLATGIGQVLLDMVDKSPVIAIKSLKVGDFQGVSLSTTSRSSVVINPESPAAKKLKSWYDSEGKYTSMLSKNGSWSMYSDRVLLSYITSNPSLGEEKPVLFSIRGYISCIKPDQAMWYKACKTCNKKVFETVIDSGYWCEDCQKKTEECCFKYIMSMKVSDTTREAWFYTFNEEAEKIIGCSADQLNKLRSEGGGDEFKTKLNEATWSSHVFRISVTQNEYNGGKKQRITVKGVAPVDFAAETRLLLQDISKRNTSSH